jgi:glucose/arabinose dehydrogenase
MKANPWFGRTAPMVIVAATSFVHAGGLPSLDTELVASGLTGANLVVAAPGDDSRLFVVQTNGIIRVIESGVLLTTPFLNIDAIVPNESFNGLIGLAFHPDYENNGYFYLHHPLGTTTSNRLTIARYTVTAEPNVADPNSREEILVLNYPSLPGHHLGGSLNFGPDGYLYIPLGDGGTTGGETAGGARSQSLASPWGKVLRIDVNDDDFRADANRNYAIPPDNPFVGQGGDEAVFALGLRNPYRSCFDSATNDFYIADVGRFSREEIDIIPTGSGGGQNFGWNCAEGTLCTTNANCSCTEDPLVDPIHEYAHADGCSVSGGAIYRGCAIEGIDGHFFFGDWCSRRIWSFRFDSNTVVEFTEWTDQLAPPGGFGAILSISAGPLGELYITDGSSVRRIIPEGGVIDRNDNGIADGCERAPCPGDIVSSDTFQPPPDGQVDAADLAFLLGAWGANPGSLADMVTSRTFAPPPDGMVDGADLAYLLGAWGVCE